MSGHNNQSKHPSPIPSRGHGGPRMPVQKAKDAKGTLKRLARYLGTYKIQLLFVIAAAILSTVFSIFSPKILAEAIDTLFNGLMNKMNGVPGAEIDFAAIGQVLVWLILLYIISALFMYIQQIIMVNISQKTIFQLRQEVHEKLERLPLKYFDRTPHDETLSRAIND